MAASLRTLPGPIRPSCGRAGARRASSSPRASLPAFGGRRGGVAQSWALSPAVGRATVPRLVMTRASEGDEPVSAEDLPPAGCERVKVQLRKPLGMTLEDNAAGDIFVVGLVEGGNAMASGMVDVGDQLIATTGMVYNTTQDYGGVSVRGGEQIVRVQVRGEKFDTIMAAIGSIPGNIPVQIELQKCRPLS